ncbi:MAG: septal ring lytic transglycosylase RlpA family protein [Alphaproteobacteria bacterium]|nr:septal ring lytic transglycosylase RlpA family protein [Alphaproteobacteria bacterium]
MDTAVYKGTPTATYKVGDPYKIDGVWYFPYEDYYYAEVGQASWYGSEDNGNFTANGEVFDSSALTAAHRTLPMPSVVRVTNVSNGKSVVVKVNDRGPFARDRIIDLSQAAAERLDFVKDGHSTVKVEILPEESKALKAELLNKGTAKAPVVEMQVEDKVVEQPKVSEPVSFEQHTPVVEEVKKPVSPVMNTDHYVQMGAFGNHMNADALARRLSDAGHNVVTEKTASGLTKVKVVGFDSKAAAKSMINTLQNQGFGKGFAR